MPYRRKYNYKGIETLLDNVVRVIKENMEAELVEIANEYGSEILPNFEEVLIADKDNPDFPCIVVKPEEDDALKDNFRLAEGNIFDITIVERQSDDLEQLTRDIMRRKKAVRNVLLNAEANDLLLGITHLPATWEVRGGRYTWVKVGNIFGRAVKGMKLRFSYSELIKQS